MVRRLDTVALAVACVECESAELTLAEGRSGELEAACGCCGASLGAWAEVKEQARAAMFDALRDDFLALEREAAARAMVASAPARARAGLRVAHAA